MTHNIAVKLIQKDVLLYIVAVIDVKGII
ncbi:hypothetical protein VAS14_11459 [Photobacterium angustum S14]|uniref:Uncharacterized protein n=1 Tax=Photobacterium angustum (strain S14 / CCUG 15956) TaxID=314292 RepID=Q1ZVY3_PHOAS|nr:hypothetical protein VAS14_11459 [Photobacterium angustum S14]